MIKVVCDGQLVIILFMTMMVPLDFPKYIVEFSSVGQLGSDNMCTGHITQQKSFLLTVQQD